MARHLTRSNWLAVVLSSTLMMAIMDEPVLAADEEGTAPPKGMQFGTRLGVDYSDNYLHSDTNQVSSYVGIAGFEIGGDHVSGRSELSAYGDLEYQEPFESSLETDVVGRMAATGKYEIVPESFNVTAAGLFTQVRPDLFRPESVNNREDVFSYAFGPQGRIRLGDSMSAHLDARYTSSNYSVRELDNDTVGGEMVVGHDGVHEGFIGLGAGYYDVSYKKHTDPSAVDYTREEAFGRLDANGARTTIRLDLGYEKVSGDSGEDSGPLVRANITRRLSTAFEAFLTYTSEFPVSDSPTIAGRSAGQTPTVVPGDESVLTAAPRRTKFGAIGLSFVRPRTQADLSYSHSIENGVLATQGERTWQELRGNFTRNFTANALGTLYAARTKEELRDLSPVPVEATETTYGAEFEVVLGRKLSMLVNVRRKNRDSELATDRYQEFTSGVYVRYGRVDSSAATGGATAPIGR